MDQEREFFIVSKNAADNCLYLLFTKYPTNLIREKLLIEGEPAEEKIKDAITEALKQIIIKTFEKHELKTGYVQLNESVREHYSTLMKIHNEHINVLNTAYINNLKTIQEDIIKILKT
jgi:hypothetical protein